MPQLQYYDRRLHILAGPLGCPIGVNARHLIETYLRIGFDEVMLNFVHPEFVAVVGIDPAGLESNVNHYELNRSFAKQFANVKRRQGSIA